MYRCVSITVRRFSMCRPSPVISKASVNSNTSTTSSCHSWSRWSSRINVNYKDASSKIPVFTYRSEPILYVSRHVYNHTSTGCYMLLTDHTVNRAGLSSQETISAADFDSYWHILPNKWVWHVLPTKFWQHSLLKIHWCHLIHTELYSSLAHIPKLCFITQTYTIFYVWSQTAIM